MKTLLRLALAAALVSGIYASMRRENRTRMRARNPAKSRVPPYSPMETADDPIRDAEPEVDGPLTNDDLRVAQNSPL
jgi:hypothetical protein